MLESWVRSLGEEDPLEEGMATHSCILVWKIPWTEDPGGYSPAGWKGSDTTEHSTLLHLFISILQRVCWRNRVFFPHITLQSEYILMTSIKCYILDSPMVFGTVVLEKILESPLDCEEIKPVHPKGNQSWIFTGRTDAEAPIPPDAKSWLTA